MNDWNPSQPYRRPKHRRPTRTRRFANAWSRRVLRWNGVSAG